MRIVRRAPASLLLAAHVALVSGCYSYQPITSPAGLDERGSSRVVQVMRREGDTFLLRGVHVEADSLIGADAGRSNERRAIALADISTLSHLEVSAGETVQVVFLVATGVALTLYLALILLLAGDRHS
jgi:hypothetical protein